MGVRSRSCKTRRSTRWVKLAGFALTAAVAGAAVGLAASMGRKMMMQSPTYMAGNWDDALKAEHKATLDTMRELERQGFDVTYLDPEPDGLLDLDKLKAALRPDTIVVSVMHVNNEIGVIQPIAEMGEMLSQRADVASREDSRHQDDLCRAEGRKADQGSDRVPQAVRR